MKNQKFSSNGEALVFVLGDIGHSPRTLNSVKKLSSSYSKIHVISYKQSNISLDSSVRNNIHFHILHEGCWKWCGMESSGFKSTKLWFIIGSILKVLIQWLMIWYYLLIDIQVYKLNLIWCQSPPSIPTFIIMYIVRYFILPLGYLFGFNDGSYKWILDWHNLAFTIMRVAHRPKFMVKISEIIEKFFGKRADIHLCVSEAFVKYLKQWADIHAIPVYDKKNISYKDSTQILMSERHSLFMRLGWKINEHETIFTKEESNRSIIYRRDRPVLLVSSTSWTPDEDFDILLKAICEYDDKHKNDDYPSLHFVITGKGPLRDHYIKSISELGLTKCKIETVWLEIEDYPILLACADLGICMHFSSSGIDLPMKVVDMFGTGLPVCAIQYQALSELVENGINGYTFQSYIELENQMDILLKEFPDTKKLEQMRENIRKGFQKLTWEDEWRNKVSKILP